jgi:hypothetical protein
MNRAELQAWIETLKPGDEVAFDERSGGWYASRYRILKVERTTKTQIITLTGHRFRKKDGQEVGGELWKNIEPVTDAVREKIRRQIAVSRFKAIRMKPDNYTTDQLEAVIEILERKE